MMELGVGKAHCYPLLLEDRPHGGEGPLVYRTDHIAVGGRVGEGVDLELEANLDDVERGDTESV
jgi:hypothetical protein